MPTVSAPWMGWISSCRGETGRRAPLDLSAGPPYDFLAGILLRYAKRKRGSLPGESRRQLDRRPTTGFSRRVGGGRCGIFEKEWRKPSGSPKNRIPMEKSPGMSTGPAWKGCGPSLPTTRITSGRWLSSGGCRVPGPRRKEATVGESTFPGLSQMWIHRCGNGENRDDGQRHQSHS